MTVIQPMSPVAAAIAAGEAPKTARSSQFTKKYPIDDLQPGTCFTVPIADANVKSLKTLASKHSKNGKEFTVITHEDLNVVEFARIK